MPTLIILSDVNVGDINQERNSQEKEETELQCSVSFIFFSTSQKSSPVSDFLGTLSPIRFIILQITTGLDKYKNRNNKPKIKTAAFLYSG